jgi:hypothetical protein
MMALLAGVANAATVTYTITYGAGSYTVDATCNAAVCNGLAFFKVDMDPATTTTLQNDSSYALAMISSVVTNIGFAQARGPTASFPMQLAGGQDPASSVQLTGVGISSVAFPVLTLPDMYLLAPTPADPIVVPAPLGSGTYSGVAPALDPNKNVAANVYNLSGQVVEVPLSDISVVFVPEPATMGMLAIGGLGLLLRRRR